MVNENKTKGIDMHQLRYQKDKHNVFFFREEIFLHSLRQNINYVQH